MYDLGLDTYWRAVKTTNRFRNITSNALLLFTVLVRVRRYLLVRPISEFSLIANL